MQVPHPTVALATLGFALLLAPACSSARANRATDAGPGVDAGPGHDAGSPGTDAATVRPRGCTEACSTADDCSLGVPYADADNFACDAGVCRGLGCRSDAECAAIPGGTYVCRDLGGGVAGCIQACSTADDCSLGVPYADADNFACEAGVCRGLGCLSDAECAAIPSGTYVCR